jgi:hypothetical protein
MIKDDEGYMRFPVQNKNTSALVGISGFISLFCITWIFFTEVTDDGNKLIIIKGCRMN